MVSTPGSEKTDLREGRDLPQVTQWGEDRGQRPRVSILVPNKVWPLPEGTSWNQRLSLGTLKSSPV